MEVARFFSLVFVFWLCDCFAACGTRNSRLHGLLKMRSPCSMFFLWPASGFRVCCVVFCAAPLEAASGALCEKRRRFACGAQQTPISPTARSGFCALRSALNKRASPASTRRHSKGAQMRKAAQLAARTSFALALAKPAPLARDPFSLGAFCAPTRAES